MRYVRCKHCGARRTLTMPLDHYIRPPRCRSCGRRKYRVDHYRGKHERSPHVKPCKCHMTHNGHYHFPHRKGSKWCEFNPKLTMEMREQWAKEKGLT